MNLPHVFARATASTTDLGYQFMVEKGRHYLADDPIVKARPDLFTEDCRYGLAFSGEPPEVMKIPPEDDDLPARPRRPRVPAAT